MMRLLAALMLLASSASARSFEGCAKADAKAADAAIEGALGLALRAAAAVGDTPDYARWFGDHDARSELVRQGLKAVHRELSADELVAVCLPPGDPDCKDGTFAYVNGRAYAVHLCPLFFAMPTLADAAAGRGDQEHGTREGTILHEVSHFRSTAYTGDACYSRPACEGLAERDPALAVATADSLQYFSEDAWLAWAAKDEP